MTVAYLSLTAPGVAGLQPYQPGKPLAELERDYGVTNAVKLASNENPLGPSPRVRAAIQGGLADLTRYPDGNGFELKHALSQRLGVAMAGITLGNGSNDLLELVARAFLTPATEAIYSQHAFAVYPIVTQAVGATHVVIPAKNWGHDLDAMAAAVTPRTRLVFIANPNNPTGTWLGHDELYAFLRGLPDHVIAVLDEAYGEYLDPPPSRTSVDWLDTLPNLLITRTFSKAYGLAGLRVGYGLSHPGLADVLNRVRQPFNVNQLALLAATAALDDDDYLSQSRTLNRQGMAQLVAGVTALGLSYIPSLANFLAVDVGRPAGPIYEGLLREGVIVRPVANYGMPHHLRITIGTAAENGRFLAALARQVGQ